jgi:hypothetical protein
MRYCPECEDEYLDTQATCPNDGARLMTEEEFKHYLDELDARPAPDPRYALAATADDAMEAELLAAALAEAHVSALVTPSRSGPVDLLSQPITYFRIEVPEEQVEKAREIVAARKAELEADAPEAARAAEEEEAKTETGGPAR